MDTKIQIPDEVSLDKPSTARIYDCLLGGYHNFEIDRAMAKKLYKVYPDVGLSAQVNRACLRRVVNFVIEQGVDQFLDIGSGLPTVGNVHDVAHKVNPATRGVYIDIDHIAIAHGKAILEDNPNITAIWGDAGDPEQILDHAEVKRLLDFDRPMAVLFMSVLHFVLDGEQAYRAVRTLRDAVAPGSYIAILYFTTEGGPPGIVEQMQKLLADSLPTAPYTRADIYKFFEGLELVEPGLVYPSLWRPESPADLWVDQPNRCLGFAGVGRKL